MLKIGDKVRIKIPSSVSIFKTTDRMRELNGTEGVVNFIKWDWTYDKILVWLNGCEGALLCDWLEKIED